MTDVHATLISQYRNSPRIKALIEGWNRLMDPRQAFEMFVRDVWDIRTATGWGLDNWGRLLDISRTWQMDDGSVYILGEDPYRALLMLKAAANISDCSAADINRILQELFSGRGVPYIVEADLLYIRYVFPFRLEEWERLMLRQESVVPRPATVGFEILEYDPSRTFGFYAEGEGEQPWMPFNYGMFTEITYAW